MEKGDDEQAHHPAPTGPPAEAHPEDRGQPGAGSPRALLSGEEARSDDTSAEGPHAQAEDRRVVLRRVLFAAVAVWCLPHSADAQDHQHAEFRCGKTFVTFHAYAPWKVGAGSLPKLHTVPKAHIYRLEWVPPGGPPFVTLKRILLPPVGPDKSSTAESLVLTRVEDWSQLVDCLD